MKTRSRWLAAIVLLAVTSAPVVAAPGIEGQWRSEREVGDADGKTYSHVTILALKVADGLLTGSIDATSDAPWMRETTGKPVEIQQGKAEGDKFSFRIVQEGKNGSRTAVYEGTISGDQMTGVVKLRGIGQTWDFVATRMQ